MEEKTVSVQAKWARVGRRDRFLILFSTTISIVVVGIVLVSPPSLEEYATLGYVGVALIGLLTSATLYSPIPPSAVVFVAAKWLLPLPLILVATAAATVGEFVAYLLGDGVDTLVEEFKWHKTMKKWFLKSPFVFLVIWIALPNPVQTVGQVFAGTVGYPWWKYGLATFLGNLIWMVLVVAAGDWLASIGLLGG